jgi:hypothetical protein
MKCKIKQSAGCWWLTLVTLASQEADQEDHGLKPAWVKNSQDPI